MIDVVIGGSLAVGFIYAAANHQPKEVRKINNVFRNINYGVGKLSPRLRNTRKEEMYTEYIYEVPPGLVDDPKLAKILPKTLRKNVSIDFNGVLIIRVYKESIPSSFNYDWQASVDWTVPLGKSNNGLMSHDFDAIPHMTIAGATRQGKSVFIRLIFSHLINSHPDDAEIYLLDLKGGMEFGKYRNLRQVNKLVTDVKGAESVLQSIVGRLKDDMTRYYRNGFSNVFEAKEKRRIFIITDEAAELADSKICRDSLSEICRLGGALGYRNIFATQYPTADTLPRQVKQNSDARISFRLPTEVASRVAIDESGAENLTHPGRAIYRTVDRHEMQVPYVSDADILNNFTVYFTEKGSDVFADEIKTEDSEAGTDIIDIGGFDLRNEPADWRRNWPRK